LNKRAFDRVTRRFNESSAALKMFVGLGLRCDTAWRDLQIQLEPRVSRSEAAVQSASRASLLVPRGTGLQLNNPTSTKKENRKYDNSPLKKIN
jgi:hypothetical protein